MNAGATAERELIREKAGRLSAEAIAAEIVRCQLGIQKASRSQDRSRYRVRIEILQEELRKRSQS